jgi:hypothetical protein
MIWLTLKTIHASVTNGLVVSAIDAIQRYGFDAYYRGVQFGHRRHHRWHPAVPMHAHQNRQLFGNHP